MDKIINSVCICKSSFTFDYNLVVLLPCEHIFHEKCIDKQNRCLNRYPNECPFKQCNKMINKIMNFKEVKKRKCSKFYNQIYVDMLANIKYSDSVDRSIINMFNKIPYMINQGCILGLFNTKDYLKFAIDRSLDICGINIKITNKHKIINAPKIIISNHTTYLDPVIMYSVFKCGFLASSIINNIPIVQRLLNDVPIIKINRGEKSNTVNSIKKFIDQNNTDICIFPEGTIGHCNTLCKFRSGAFNVGYPIQPIVIKYDPIIYDDDYKEALLKIVSVNKINVEIIVLDVEYPPFNMECIECIRYKMSKAGKLVLSRVSNQFIIDDNYNGS